MIFKLSLISYLLLLLLLSKDTVNSGLKPFSSEISIASKSVSIYSLGRSDFLLNPYSKMHCHMIKRHSSTLYFADKTI